MIEGQQKSEVSSLVYTPHKQRGITRTSVLGRVWYDFPSRTYLAGLSALLHKAKRILFYSRVLRGV